jgi:membrane protein insertase Oxa1/YidC/SpoIIIJ
MILRIILWTIVLTVVVRFIFNFLLPVIGITNAASQKMKEMQRQMDEMQRRQEQQKASTQKKAEQIDGDYIDYEEVK